jgi:hypothetical protein
LWGSRDRVNVDLWLTSSLFLSYKKPHKIDRWKALQNSVADTLVAVICRNARLTVMILSVMRISQTPTTAILVWIAELGTGDRWLSRCWANRGLSAEVRSFTLRTPIGKRAFALLLTR